MSQEQPSLDSPFSIERKEGKAPGTVIFHFRGPLAAREMYASLPLNVLQNLLDLREVPDEELPVLNILDLSEVPYMDSRGLGIIVRNYVHCQGKGVKFFAAGATPRVLDLFKITKVDGVLPLVASVEDAEASN